MNYIDRFLQQNGNSDNSSSPGRVPAQDSDELDLKRLFFMLWHHKWIIIGSVVLSTLIAGAIAYTETPIYRSSGTLLVSEEKNQLSGAGGELSNLLTSTYGVGTGSTIANELQFLRSRTLSQALADTLIETRTMSNGELFPVLYTEYPEDSTVASAATVASRLRNGLTFSRDDQQADVISILFESPSPLEAATIVDLTMEQYMAVSRDQNRRATTAAVQFLENERARVQKELAEAEDSLRSFMNSEQLVQVDAQTSGLISSLAQLESGRQEARVRLVTVESGIARYQQRLDDIRPGLADQYADAVGPNMNRLQYSLAELEIEKMQLMANNPELRNAETPPRELREINQKIELYRQQIREKTQELMDEGDQFLGMLGGSDGNIAQAVMELNERLIELQVQEEQYRAQLDVINEQLAGQQAIFENLPDNMTRLVRLKRDVTINEELFLTISQQYAEMSLWKETQFGLGRPIDDGYIPGLPIKPNKPMYLLIGFLIGAVGGTGYIFIRQAFNTKIDSIEKLKELDVPLLSVIPDIDPFVKETFGGFKDTELHGERISTSLVSVLDTISPITESFRRLVSNIVYSNPDIAIKSLLITSSTKSEGKTTVAANLGAVLAEAGYNVVIVDADLRRPRLHEMFDVQRSSGIMEVLFENVPVEEAVQKTLVPKLSVLTAGERPPNPSAITQSRAFLQTIKDLEKSYDFVLIDTPPYGIITDASAVIQQTDGVVLVTRFNETNEAELSHVMANLKRIRAEVLGTVLTAFDHKKTSDYNYSSTYYKELYQDYTTYHEAKR